MKPTKIKFNSEPIEEIEVQDTVAEPIEVIEDEPTFEPIKGIITGCTSLYVRSAPHTNATPVDTLDAGSVVDIIGVDGDFWQIKSPEGYSMKKFIKVV